MIYVLYLVHVLISVFLILVVLLQQGKGADLSVFGGGSSQAAFGARGAATVLHKLTVICFVLFIVTTLWIGILQSQRAPSVMGGVEEAGGEVAEAPGSPTGGELPASDATDGAVGAEAEPEASPPEGGGEIAGEEAPESPSERGGEGDS